MGLQAVASWLRGTTSHTVAHMEPNRHVPPHLISTEHITGLLQCIVLHCWEQCAPHRSDFWHQEVVTSAQKPWLNVIEKSIKKHIHIHDTLITCRHYVESKLAEAGMLSLN